MINLLVASIFYFLIIAYININLEIDTHYLSISRTVENLPLTKKGIILFFMILMSIFILLNEYEFKDMYNFSFISLIIINIYLLIFIHNHIHKYLSTSIFVFIFLFILYNTIVFHNICFYMILFSMAILFVSFIVKKNILNIQIKYLFLFAIFYYTLQFVREKPIPLILN